MLGTAGMRRWDYSAVNRGNSATSSPIFPSKRMDGLSLKNCGDRVDRRIHCDFFFFFFFLTISFLFAAFGPNARERMDVTNVDSGRSERLDWPDPIWNILIFLLVVVFPSCLEEVARHI
jgi:hypothetical protein